MGRHHWLRKNRDRNSPRSLLGWNLVQPILYLRFQNQDPFVIFIKIILYQNYKQNTVINRKFRENSKKVYFKWIFPYKIDFLTLFFTFFKFQFSLNLYSYFAYKLNFEWKKWKGSRFWKTGHQGFAYQECEKELICGEGEP